MLRPRHLRFCEALAAGSDIAAAYQAAYGIEDRHVARSAAARLLHRDDVQAELSRLREPVIKEVQHRATVTAKEIIDGLKELAEKAESDAARVAAYRLLGQHVGLFQERDPLEKLLANVSGQYGQGAADLMRQTLINAGQQQLPAPAADASNGNGQAVPVTSDATDPRERFLI